MRLILLLSAFVLSAAALPAQSSHSRDGFWIGFGLGASTNDLECTGCLYTGASDPWRGGFGSGGFLAMGGAVSPQLLLGGETAVASVIGENRDASIASLLFLVKYYPAIYEGFHVSGAMGPTVFLLEGNGSSVEASGFAVRAGVGYDLAMGRRFAITPYANIARTMVQQGSLSVSGAAGPVTKLENKMVAQFGVSFNWY
jgi:hypothetical protein